MRENSPLEKNAKESMITFESQYFATPSEIIDSSKDHQWWKTIADQDIHSDKALPHRLLTNFKGKVW